MKRILATIILLLSALSASATVYNTVITTRNGGEQRLNPDDYIISSNGRYKLLMQWDGNLVVYRSDGAVIWASNSAGKGGAYALLQADYNLVVYTANRTPIWASNSNQKVYDINTQLLLSDDGSLKLSSMGNTAIWSTPGDGSCPNGAKASLYPVCISNMNQFIAACSMTGATIYAQQFGGYYGTCH